jgi:hypothetical protein
MCGLRVLSYVGVVALCALCAGRATLAISFKCLVCLLLYMHCRLAASEHAFGPSRSGLLCLSLLYRSALLLP